MCPPTPQDDPWLSNITSRLYKSFTSSWNTKKNISQFNNEVWFIWSANDNKQRDYLCWWVASWTISGNNLEKIRLWQDSNLCLPNTNWTLLPTEISQVGSKAYLEDSSFPWLKWYLKLKNFTDMNLTFRFNFFFTDSNHSWKQLCYSQFRRK